MKNIDRVTMIKQSLFYDNEDVDALNKLIHPKAIINSPANFSKAVGPTALKAVINHWKSAFPDAKSTWASQNEDEDGTVIIQLEAEGTHTGSNFFGILAKGQSISYTGKTIYKFSDEKLVYYEVDVDIDQIKTQLEV